MITQQVSKEDREAGNQGAILGNAKVFWSDNGNVPQQGLRPQANLHSQQPQQGADQFDDDIPF